MCRQHPWFTLHLPRYLAVMQADTIANTATLDEDILHEVVKLGFKRQEVVKSIQKRSQNKVRLPALPSMLGIYKPGSAAPGEVGGAQQHPSSAAGLWSAALSLIISCKAERSTLGCMQATVAYFLMADNRRRMPSSAYLRAELTEAHQAHQGYPPGAPPLCCLLCCTALACEPCFCIVEVPLAAVAEGQIGRGYSDTSKQERSLPCLLQSPGVRTTAMSTRVVTTLRACCRHDVSSGCPGAAGGGGGRGAAPGGGAAVAPGGALARAPAPHHRGPAARAARAGRRLQESGALQLQVPQAVCCPGCVPCHPPLTQRASCELLC